MTRGFVARRVNVLTLAHTIEAKNQHEFRSAGARSDQNGSTATGQTPFVTTPRLVMCELSVDCIKEVLKYRWPKHAEMKNALTVLDWPQPCVDMPSVRNEAFIGNLQI